ncbi:MAG: PstS family phosphate ABC transporter substrate-binding protein [Xanthomonadales bacterium]|nr:PstS family phosphate ABC transporter substrate-binding protein [Xanthomonadales bacterium]
MLAGCRKAGSGQSAELIQIDGSSTVYPIIEAMAEEFQIAEQGAVNVTVGISGSGGGLKKFCRGELAIANASRPIEASEIRNCQRAGVNFIELPIAYDAITLVVHPHNQWVQSLDVATLKQIWEPQAQGRVTRWSDLNPDFPDASLNLYGAGPDSGTFDYFTAVINGDERASRGDYTASEDDNILVRGVANDKFALGYFGLAYYHENSNQLKALAVINQQGNAVLPSLDSVRGGAYQPLSRPVFMYVNTQMLQQKGVRRFLDFFFAPKNRTEIITWVGYIPLAEATYERVLDILNQERTGSRFRDDAGHVVSVEQALHLL